MDPDATIREFLALILPRLSPTGELACKEREWELLTALADWLRRGGFRPTVAGDVLKTLPAVTLRHPTKRTRHFALARQLAADPESWQLTEYDAIGDIRCVWPLYERITNG